MKYDIGTTVAVTNYLWLRVVEIDEPNAQYKVRCVRSDRKHTLWKLDEEDWVPAKQLDIFGLEIMPDTSYKRYIKLSGLYNK